MSSSQRKDILEIAKIIFRDSSFLREIIVFVAFYIFILLQKWDSLVFISIPLISFGFLCFFNVLRILGTLSEFKDKVVKYRPFGNLKVISDRIYFCMSLELIIVFVIGAESLYHPQLIDNHFVFYVLILISIYIFTMYYVLHDIGMYSKLELLINEAEIVEDTNKHHQTGDDISSKAKLLSYLKLDQFRRFYKFITLSFIIIESIWVLFWILSYFDLLNITLSLPGSSLMEGSPISTSFVIYVIIGLIPSIIVYFLYNNYSIIKRIQIDKCKQYLTGLNKIERERILRMIKFYVG
ncbi:MAG: hypothetical protein GF364_03900 [Candidatus Lokiarchaeota archaeon]|nr:hypothetical protein [Candidatus Lokiarchaeota archaeon]